MMISGSSSSATEPQPLEPQPFPLTSVVSQNADDDEQTLGDPVTRLFRPSNDTSALLLHPHHSEAPVDVDAEMDIDEEDGPEPTDEDVQALARALQGDGSPPKDISQEQHRAQFRAMGGAAVVGGVAGLLLLGPIVGLVAAGGAAAAAVVAPGQAGERVRATGEVVAKAGDRLKALDQRHHIVDHVTHGFHQTAHFLSEKLEPCYNPKE
mmetsp:Transcript_33405/g.69561  ORF Transcript_33405/g.69561 Transcript_33405/m.69561 type:complete len:209 (-) Transcript_33405:143-769(-)